MIPFANVLKLQAQTPSILRIGLSAFPPNLEPWNNSGVAAGAVKLMIFRGLLTYAPDGAFRGELAESWSQPDPTTWVFKLRDVQFQNGDPVTADEIKWNLEQIIAENSSAYYKSEFKNALSGIEAQDARTLVLKTTQPTATLLSWFASFNTPIVSRRSVEEGATVGAGPYRVTGQERGSWVELTRSDNYYKPGKAAIERVRIVAYPDENLRLAALRAGDVDLIDYVPWQAMAEIEADSSLKLDAVDAPCMYLTFNGTRAPFNDVRVRRAIAHAIKREDIVAAAFFGRGAPLMHLPIAKESPYYNAEFEGSWNYNPDLSRKLLAEAGFADGFTADFLSTAQYGMYRDTSVVVQQHLEAVGIKTQLQLTDWATNIDRRNRGQFEFALGGSAGDSPDPDSLSNLIDSSLAPSFFRSFGLPLPEIDEQLKLGRFEMDVEKRKAIYREVERLSVEQVPIVSLCWRSQGWAMTSKLSGFRTLPGALCNFSGITVEDAQLA